MTMVDAGGRHEACTVLNLGTQAIQVAGTAGHDATIGVGENSHAEDHPPPRRKMACSAAVPVRPLRRQSVRRCGKP